jgi:hypothetical protein
MNKEDENSHIITHRRYMPELMAEPPLSRKVSENSGSVELNQWLTLRPGLELVLEHGYQHRLVGQ